MSAFEVIALRISNATDAELLHAFTWGLKERIRQEIRLRAPTSLQDAACIALDMDKRLKSVPSEHPTQGQCCGDGRPTPQQCAAPHHGPVSMELDNMQTKHK